MTESHTPPHSHAMGMACEIGKGNAKAMQCKGNDLPPSTATQEVELERAPAIPVSAEPGNLRLRAYLTADPKARERFDRRQAREILADCDSDHRIANELSGDPVYERVQARRRFEAWLIEQDDQ